MLRFSQRCVWVLCSVIAAPAALSAAEIRDAVPSDVYLVVHGRHNPERDYQREYFAAVWETVEETRLVERISEIIEGHVPADDLEEARRVIDELKAAAAPIDWESLADMEEVIYAQRMNFPTSQHLVLVRSTPEAARSCYDGLLNLMKLAQKYSDDAISVSSTERDGLLKSALILPAEVPFQPVIAVTDDVFLFASAEQMARRSIELLQGSGGESKLDDPRLREALQHLPEPEDALVFFDGRQMFEQLRGFGGAIRALSQGDERAARAAALIEAVIDEMDIIDYEVTVEFTDGYRNRTAARGRLIPGREQRVLARMLGSGQPFEQWHQWVPESASAYALTTGVNLQPLHAWVVEFLRERIPESREALAQYEEFQRQIDINIEEDLLGAFSGESISISLPPQQPSPGAQGQSALLLKCTKPDRVQELIDRLFAFLGEFPPLKAQQITLQESADLEGFQEISAGALMMFGARPVIGFHEQWLVIASDAGAVQAVVDARNADKNITDSEAFQQFGLEISGPVYSISYTDLAKQTREMAAGLAQMGAFLPMMIGMAGAQADPEALQTFQEIVVLLPAVGQVVAKFDYFEAKLAVTQAGDEPGTWTKQSVTLVRPPEE